MSEIYKKELMLNTIELLNKVDQCEPEFDIYCFAIAHLLPKEAIATLKALVREGPLHARVAINY